MIKQQEQVRLFMKEVKQLNLPSTVCVPHTKTRALCMSLIAEELGETVQATSAYEDNPNLETLVEVADGLADLLYVVLYAANAYGIDLDPVFDEVQRSNMTKKGGPMREDGKQLKPASYEPPNLLPILIEQTAHAEPIAFVNTNNTVRGYLRPDGTVINITEPVS